MTEHRGGRARTPGRRDYLEGADHPSMFVTRPAAVAAALTVLAAAFVCGLPRTRAQQPAPKKAKVMLLGTYHFGNPNLDYLKSSVDDHLSPKRQAEIEEVAAAIAKFKPTKIAVEAVDGVSKVPQHYLDYVQGSYTLSADERDQLGMRVA